MSRRIILCFTLLCAAGFACFGQASALRDYVGMISQNFHPEIISFMEKFQENLQKQGHSDAAKSIGHFLKGDSGTGFIYVAGDGTNYILTNYHVISQADSLSVTFEKVDGEKTIYTDLSIVAADEDIDIALLAFSGGQKPFRQGLAFLDRPVHEGDDVYSAGFPGLGTTMIWQLGRGMVSNASVRLPLDDDSGRIMGPFIQHTAQVDPGNSGGPLLVQTQGVPTGFAVVGINTLSARHRQAANFSIPLNQIRSFLDASMKAKTGTAGLNERIDSFIKGLNSSKAVYPHIASYLSNTCTAENAEYALSEMINRAPRHVQDDIVEVFTNSPVDGMAHAVAWTIENALRSGTGKIAVEKESVAAVDDNNYTVTFKVNNKTIRSEWTNEYGIWRIRIFGDFAAGDKSLVSQRAGNERLHSNPSLQISAGMAYIVERGAGFGADLYLRSMFFGSGIRTYIASGYFQAEGVGGVFLPIRAGDVAFTPFGNIGLGVQFGWKDSDDFPFDLGVSFQGGLQFTTAAIPGLYFQAAYQYNLYFFSVLSDGDRSPPDRKIVFIGIGYAF